MNKNNAAAFNRGDKVSILAPEGADVYRTQWWPKGEITGTVEKTFKNGNIAVAIDQMGNRSADHCRTMNIPFSWLTAR